MKTMIIHALVVFGPMAILMFGGYYLAHWNVNSDQFSLFWTRLFICVCASGLYLGFPLGIFLEYKLSKKDGFRL